MNPEAIWQQVREALCRRNPTVFELEQFLGCRLNLEVEAAVGPSPLPLTEGEERQRIERIEDTIPAEWAELMLPPYARRHA